MTERNPGTEQKIKVAAKILFQEKGFAATKTREIAEAADTNLALVNYYFRSKQKLFDEIMRETLQELMAGVFTILDNPNTNFDQKIQAMVDFYIDLFSVNKNLPSFIMNTVRDNPKEYLNQVPFTSKIAQSVFFHQFQERLVVLNKKPINPMHFVINFIALTVFPFITLPIASQIADMDEDAYYQFINERRMLIPKWIKATLELS